MCIQAPNYCAVTKVARPFSSLGAHNHVGGITWLPDSDFDDLKIFNKTLSLTEIQDLVKSKGLSFGINLSKFKLDEE